MKKYSVLILAAIIMAGGSVLAQDVKPVMKSGAKSLNFTFGGFGSFGLGGAGASGGLGMSFFTSSDAAFRLGLQGIIRKETEPYTGTTAGSDGTGTETAIGFGVDYLMYMSAMTPRVKPYWGLGAEVALSSSSAKPAMANNATSGVTEVKNGKGTEGTSFGVQGIIGAEFFLYSELSLSAEYQLNLISVASLSDRVVSSRGNPDETTKRGSTMQILGFGSAGATLHIYF